MGGVKCLSLRPEKERENICFFYTVPILYSFIYSPIKRMGRSKGRQRVQSLFISFNTNLCIFYPLFFLWIFLSSTKHYFSYFRQLEKDFVQMARNWTSAGLHITHFSMLYSRLVSKRSFLCLEN